MKRKEIIKQALSNELNRAKDNLAYEINEEKRKDDRKRQAKKQVKALAKAIKSL